MNRIAQRRHLIDRAIPPTHPATAFIGGAMRRLGTITDPSGIALQLGAQRAGRAPKTIRNRVLRVPRSQAGLDLDAFGQTQNRVLHHSGVSGRGGIGNRRNRTGTAEPVPVRFLHQGGTPCRNAKGGRCGSIRRGFVQVGHSNLSLSVPREGTRSGNSSKVIFNSAESKWLGWMFSKASEERAEEQRRAGFAGDGSASMEPIGIFNGQLCSIFWNIELSGETLYPLMPRRIGNAHSPPLPVGHRPRGEGNHAFHTFPRTTDRQ